MYYSLLFNKLHKYKLHKQIVMQHSISFNLLLCEYSWEKKLPNGCLYEFKELYRGIPK